MARMIIVFLVVLIIPSVSLCETDPSTYLWPRMEKTDSLDFQHVSSIASFKGDLLVFNIQKRVGDTTKSVDGCWDGEILKEIPQGDFKPRKFLHTVWDNRLILGGSHSFANEGITIRKCLMYYDGNSWGNVSEEFTGEITAMVIWDKMLVVAGKLDIEGHPGLTNLACFDGDRWLSLGMQPEGGGEARITCLTTHEDDLVVGGLFSTIGGQHANNMARFDGENWHSLGTASNGLVNSLASFRGQIYTSGKFSCMGGKEIEHLARWDGEQWFSLLSDHPDAGKIWYPNFSRIKLKAFPDGLYLTGNVGVIYGQPGATLHRWNGTSWDAGFPPLARTWVNSRPAYPNCPKLKKGETQPHSQARSWTDALLFRVQIERESRVVGNLIWHNGQLLVRSWNHSSGGTGESRPRIEALEPDGWGTLFAWEKMYETKICSYKDGMLVKRRAAGGKSYLGLKNSQGFAPLSSWNEDLDMDDHTSFHVWGDSIFVVGALDNDSAIAYHNIALYDGQFWQQMGNGIAFDKVGVENFVVTPDNIYLKGIFRNYCCRAIRGMLQWDGKQWDMVDVLEKGARRDFFASHGSILYCSFSDKTAGRSLYNPDHELVNFPIESQPKIQQWTGTGWQTVWQGETGVISGFAHDGSNLWATIACGIDANVLRLRDGKWEVVSDFPFPGQNATEFNQISKPLFYDGSLVVKVRGPRPGLAYWRQGQWQWLGPSLSSLKSVIARNDTLWVSGTRFNPDQNQSRYDQSWWSGPLPTGEAIEPANLQGLAEYQLICQGADQTVRQDLDFPWPEGIEHRKIDADFSDWNRPGWHLSSWIDPAELDQIVHATDEGSIVVDLARNRQLQFSFFWPLDGTGQLHVEYRLPDFEGWPRDKCDHNSLAYPDHPDLPCLAKPPWIEIEDSRSRRILSARDSSWQKAVINFKMIGPTQSSKVIFGSGSLFKSDQVSDHSSGRMLEIRNLRITHDVPDPKLIKQEIQENLRAYSWPPEALRDLENLFSRPDSLMFIKGRKFSVASAWMVDMPGGFQARLLPNNSMDIDEWRQRRRDLSSVVTNLSNSAREHWIPGGGLYLRHVFPNANGEPNILRGLISDETKRRFVKGVIVDLREQRTICNKYALKGYSSAQKQYGIFAQRKSIWGHVSAKPLGDLTTLYVGPEGEPWPDIPVVVLVGEKTPGHHLMVLQAIPKVTTVGRPSAPLMLPTRAQSMHDGQWNFFPTGTFISPQGKNVSLCRIEPDIMVPLHASYDTAVRMAMEIIGIVPDPNGGSCPLE